MSNKSTIVYTDHALRWMGAALYATSYSNQHAADLPRFEELPERLRRDWSERGRQWLEAIIPLLETRDA